LASGEERVAIGADFEPEVTDRRPGLKRISTNAGNGGFSVFRVNSSFHGPAGSFLSAI
jgi:hypothetical protein